MADFLSPKFSTAEASGRVDPSRARHYLARADVFISYMTLYGRENPLSSK